MLERKLTAILCADVYGYSRLMGEDEEPTLRTLSTYRKIIDSLIENHRGRFVNSAGDSLLAEFTSVVESVNCAVDIQTALRAENEPLPLKRRMEFRIRLNLGDVMVEGEQIYGDGVNVAARLESLAEPGGICISRTVHDSIKNKLELAFDDLGKQAVKNIAEPVHVWRVLIDGRSGKLAETGRSHRPYWRSGVLSLTGAAIVVVTVLVIQHISFKPPRTHASIPPQAKPALSLPSVPSIAVLPFTNLSGDPQQEYFSDGISNQLIEELSRLPGLLVIARNSSFAYKSKAISEHEIGNRLGARYLLEGNIHRASDRVRIGVELVDAGSGTELWTQLFDRPFRDIFTTQDEIVVRVKTTLGLVVTLNEMGVQQDHYSRLTDNLDAFDAYLRALGYFSRGTKEGAERAIPWFDKAVELDPKFANAYAYLGWCNFFRLVYQPGRNDQASISRAKELAHQPLLSTMIMPQRSRL